MGVVSNGMLCSGDELNLTGDADGILILAAGRADRRAARRPLRRRRPRCRREAEPRRRPVADRAGPRGRRDHRRAAPLAGDGSDRGRPRRRRPADASTCATRLVPAVRRPLGGRRDRRAIAGPRPDAAARGRPAADQQRRRRQQLRDARARASRSIPTTRTASRSTHAGRRRLVVRRAVAGRAARDDRPRRAGHSTPTRC